jgi:hypothetical protein
LFRRVATVEPGAIVSEYFRGFQARRLFACHLKSTAAKAARRENCPKNKKKNKSVLASDSTSNGVGSPGIFASGTNHFPSRVNRTRVELSRLIETDLIRSKGRYARKEAPPK